MRDALDSRRLVWLLMVEGQIACALLMHAEAQTPLVPIVVWSAVTSLVALWIAAQTAQRWPTFVAWRVDVLLALAGLVVFAPGGLLAGVDDSAPITLKLLASLRNIALVASCFAHAPRMQRVAVSTSLSVAMIAGAMNGSWSALVISVLVAMTLALYLAQRHWESLPPTPGTSLRVPPSFQLSLCLLLALTLLGGAILYPTTTQSWLGEISAADLWQQRQAIKSYEELDKENAEALNELADQRYGGAAEDAGSSTKKKSKKAKPKQASTSSEDASFSLRREAPKPQDLDAARSQALLQASAKGPRRIPMVAYEQFDGATWQPREGKVDFDDPTLRPRAALEIASDRAWLDAISQMDVDLRELQSAQPTGGVDASREALWQWAMQMQGGGQVINLEQYPVDPHDLERLLAEAPPLARNPEHLLSGYDQQLLEAAFAQAPAELRDKAKSFWESSPEFRNELLRRYLALRAQQPGRGLPEDIDRLLQTWIKDQPAGWAQISAVVENMRRHATYDPSAVASPPDADPIRHFLIESKRGPDYLFASATAVLLRHLGHPSRMVGGFYVRPEKYHWLTGTTSVDSEDLHYWTQVQLANGTWVNLEPTPGFDPPQPLVHWYTPALNALQVARAWSAENRGIVLCVGLIALLLVLLRKQLLAAVYYAIWRVSLQRDVATAVRGTWRLLERRSQLAQSPRPPGQTLAVWSEQIAAGNAATQRHLQLLANLAVAARHSPRGVEASTEMNLQEVRTLCRQVVQSYPPRALRRTTLTTPD